jgi:hypothetical protein
MGSVVISGNTYQIYGTSAAAVIYHDASIGDAGDAFNAAVANDQNKALVAATRMLDRQRWKGLPVGVPQIDVVLEWPRTGVTDRYGNAVSSLVVPDDLIVGAYELAAMLLDDSTLQDSATSGSNVASVGAGPAQVSFFRPTIGVYGRFATRIQELVGQYLAGAATLFGEAFGNTEDDESTSAFDTTDADSIVGPF